MPLPIPARNLVGKRVNWSTEGRSDLRAIDRDTALRLLKALNRFLKTDAGGTSNSWRASIRLYSVFAWATGGLSIASWETKRLKSFVFRIAAKLTVNLLDH